MQQNNYTADNRITINCRYCPSKLRVPVNKGKLSVTCPVCRKETIYNPDSILHTLYQIFLGIKYMLQKDRRARIIAIATVLIVLAALFFVIFKPLEKKDTNSIPQSPRVEVKTHIDNC